MPQEEGATGPVLILDDDIDFAESLMEMLEGRGYSAFCVETPDEAIAALREPPDGGPVPPIALIDVRLGVASGVDLMPRLQAEQPELICVLMTAHLDRQTAIAALRRGAYDYFDKSGDPTTLFALIDRCIDRVELQRQREAAYEALRIAKDQAEAASRGKSAFMATMSHELRTPLNAIIGFSEMMLREVLGALGNDQYRAYVSDIHESGTHLLQIINDILDISKAEAGKLEIYEEVFDLRDTIRSVRQLMSNRIRSGALSESVDIPADLPLLRADERKTKQVLLNLVTNAVKFTPSGGHVGIVASFDCDTGISLRVTDNGIGIPEGDLTRVLQPFEQVDSSLSRQHQGTGLGLPLVKAIMELHGGNLDLRSEVGVGTEATVTFPPQRATIDPNANAAEASRNAA
ncbi:MAG TPA: ATP-binding protein [Stellaceae bacterium]|nr:ATP-binding protein [Stellaceae bacterium]